MSGAIIVTGLEHHLPGLGKMVERLIIVRDGGPSTTIQPRDDSDDGAMANANGMSDMNGMAGMNGAAAHDEQELPGGFRPNDTNKHPCGPDPQLFPTLNGATHPDITIKPGEQQFFRLVNATGHKTLKLAVDGESLEVVAIDGFALDSYPGTPPTMTVPYIILPAAGRAEFVVTGPAGGHARFRSACYDSGPNGDPDPLVELANVVAPPGHNTAPVAHHRLAVGAALPSNVYTTSLPAPSEHRQVVFGEGKNYFFINGKHFSMNDPPMYTARAGTTEEWRVLNVTREIHDFHIHQIHFLVLSINGQKVEHPYWQDSVVLPHRRGVGARGLPGSVVLLMDFRDKVIRGTFVFHCHIADHEDHGMMAKIKVI
jgi:FtsP/CotA-like multicopper oxidase with cupredoxin domain